MDANQKTAPGTLAGYPFPVLFSSGAEHSARQHARRCAQAYAYLSDLFDFAPAFRLLVLSPADWETLAAFPLYGLPHTAHGNEIVVGVSAGEFWQNVFAPVLPASNPEEREKLFDIYGNSNGNLDAKPFADLLSVHELGHLYHEQIPFRFPRLWLSELFANLCLHAHLVAAEPEHLPVWTALPEKLASMPSDHMQYRSLADFERLYIGVGAENYVWYQFQLIVMTRAIYEAGEVDVVQRLYHAFRTRQIELTDEQLAQVLETEVHPVVAEEFRAWPTE